MYIFVVFCERNIIQPPLKKKEKKYCFYHHVWDIYFLDALCLENRLGKNAKETGYGNTNFSSLKFCPNSLSSSEKDTFLFVLRCHLESSTNKKTLSTNIYLYILGHSSLMYSFSITSFHNFKKYMRTFILILASG